MTDPQPVLQSVQAWLDVRKADPLYFVGYSGGLDSTVLLHALATLAGPQRLHALHINHQLHAQANSWQRHCEQTAQAMGCAIDCISVAIAPGGEGLESAARQARYKAFDARMPAQTSLWLAHHLDDQLETLMLRLLRGSGLTGLAAMSANRAQAHYQLIRPLLDLSREQLHQYAQAHQLSWIEDDSNENDAYDRNFLRNQVMPLLESRWPGYRQTLARSRQHLAYAAERERTLWREAVSMRCNADGSLRLSGLAHWQAEDIDSLLYAWLQQWGLQAPSSQRLEHIRREVIAARSDAKPQVQLDGGSVRRFQQALYWVPAPPAIGQPPEIVLEQWQSWPGIGALQLLQSTEGSGRVRSVLPNLNWRLRAGGEHFWAESRSKGRDLKRWLAEARVPPWQRERLPLLFSGDDLIAVSDLAVDRRFAAAEGEPGLKIAFRTEVSD